MNALGPHLPASEIPPPVNCCAHSLFTVLMRGLSRASELCGLCLLLAVTSNVRGAENPTMDVAPAAPKISYYREIRPILQANCQGCHQPDKAKGGYTMTDLKGLLAGGENEGAAVTPEHPDQSSMLKMVTPQNGEARMPKGKNPLAESEVALITSWIQQGALD